MDGKRKPRTALQRGGILIPTSNGNIQYGIPPETIKDTMKLDGGVPHTFIVPSFMFDLAAGVSVADIEFPIYFNYFIRKKKARIVCTEPQKKRLQIVLSEALFGPEDLDIGSEFKCGKDTIGFPDLNAEMQNFKQTPTGILTMNDLVTFCVINEKGVAAFETIEVHIENDGEIHIYEGGKELASIAPKEPIVMGQDQQFDFNTKFQPPVFGITTLGAGHGFDPDASTSGIIIWVNRRGIVIDPPVGSKENLLRLGVSPKLIDKVVLTHCHADHDAGTLQKILQEGKINLYTTPTIFLSFLRKSAALTGIEEAQLQKLVRFFPVRIGETMIIDEAKFQFNYTLHSIPTISIQASLGEKSMIYSSDTMNDPSYIERVLPIFNVHLFLVHRIDLSSPKIEPNVRLICLNTATL